MFTNKLLEYFAPIYWHERKRKLVTAGQIARARMYTEEMAHDLIHKAVVSGTMDRLMSDLASKNKSNDNNNKGK